MLDKMMKLLGYEKLSNIKIREDFKKTPPKRKKLDNKWEFYIIYGKFEQAVVLDRNNYLLDGYTTYLIAEGLEKKYIKVKRVAYERM